MEYKFDSAVESLGQLSALALNRKSVICPNSPCFNRNLPAAVILSMQGRLIQRLLMSGMYVYIKK